MEREEEERDGRNNEGPWGCALLGVGPFADWSLRHP